MNGVCMIQFLAPSIYLIFNVGFGSSPCGSLQISPLSRLSLTPFFPGGKVGKEIHLNIL